MSHTRSRGVTPAKAPAEFMPGCCRRPRARSKSAVKQANGLIGPLPVTLVLTDCCPRARLGAQGRDQL
eukprot:162858-Chlamydomonas_euryale.AAC.2